MTSIIYIGMDVHKNTFNLCALDGQTGEILGEVQCDAKAKIVAQFAKRKAKGYEGETLIKVGYEAGCLGFALYHELTELGLDCDILAPTTMHRSSKNKLVKNDRLDARMIAQNLASGTYKAVHVPDAQDLETREFIRMVQSAKKALKRIKQEIKALVLRHGYHYAGKIRWTIAYMKWLRGLELPELLRETLDEYLSQYDQYTDRIERYERRMVELSKEERYAQPVAFLRAFKGIETQSAMIMQVEISDFTRFAKANTITSYLGLTPAEHSSGGKIQLGGISKQGNSLVRKTLIECARALVKGGTVKSKALKARQKGLPTEVIDYADRAVERLRKRYFKMIRAGKASNKAITAIARELACFVWGMSTGRIEHV